MADQIQEIEKKLWYMSANKKTDQIMHALEKIQEQKEVII